MRPEGRSRLHAWRQNRVTQNLPSTDSLVLFGSRLDEILKDALSLRWNKFSQIWRVKQHIYVAQFGYIECFTRFVTPNPVEAPALKVVVLNTRHILPL